MSNKQVKCHYCVRDHLL